MHPALWVCDAVQPLSYIQQAVEDEEVAGEVGEGGHGGELLSSEGDLVGRRGGEAWRATYRDGGARCEAEVVVGPRDVSITGEAGRQCHASGLWLRPWKLGIESDDGM
jgi:hypothetical protein